MYYNPFTRHMKNIAIVTGLLLTATVLADWLNRDSNNSYSNAKISALCCSSDGVTIYQAIANDAGGPAILLKSTDKGQTWLKYAGSGIPERKRDGNWSALYNLDEPEEAEITSLACTADGSVLFVGLHRRGKSYPTLLRTINGGDGWMVYVGR